MFSRNLLKRKTKICPFSVIFTAANWENLNLQQLGTAEKIILKHFRSNKNDIYYKFL